MEDVRKRGREGKRGSGGERGIKSMASCEKQREQASKQT